MKRALLISDLHAGGKHSLTPPDWLTKTQPVEVLSKIWEFYTNEVDSYGDLDFAVLNGDGVDGPARKDPTVMAYTDLEDQTDIALAIMMKAATKRWYVVAGTGYHVHQDYDFEKLLVHKLRENGVEASWHPSLRLKVYDKWYQFRHTGRRSDTPYGQYTQLMKEAERIRKRESRKGMSEDQLSYAVFRAHVHYFAHAENREMRGYSMPCYKLEGTDPFSLKMMAYLYDIGHLYAEFEEDQDPYIRKRLVPFNISANEDEIHV